MLLPAVWHTEFGMGEAMWPERGLPYGLVDHVNDHMNLIK